MRVTGVIQAGGKSTRMGGQPKALLDLGGRRIIGTWPVQEQPLSLEEREEVQTLLLARGYEVGSVDGVLGLKSRKAARGFQKELGWPQDGFINKALLEELRRRKSVNLWKALVAFR